MGDQNTLEKVDILVFDDDFGKDDTLGKTSLDIIAIQRNKKIMNQWIPLEDCKSGEVLLSAEFVPLASVKMPADLVLHTVPEQTKESVKEITSIPKQPTEDTKLKDYIPKKNDDKTQEQDLKKQKLSKQGKVLITVYKAKDIEKKGMFGKADPYVKMTLGKQKAKSSTVKNDHNPEWNFESKFDVDQSTAENIIVSVFDEDLGKDDSLGNTSLNVSSIQKQEKLLNQWFPLENCKSGEVLLSAEFIPLANVESQKDVRQLKVKESGKESVHEVDIESKKKAEEKKPVETITKPLFETSSVPSSMPKKVLEKGQISITVYKARDIEKKGMFGKADPYVKIMLDTQKATSATVKDNHNPEWNFTTIFDIDKNTTQKMTIAVFDEDLGK